MDSTQSTTIDTPSKQHRWERDDVSRLIQQIRLDQNDGKSLNQIDKRHQMLLIFYSARVKSEACSGVSTTTVRFVRSCRPTLFTTQ